jgi:hypothetical protein
MARKNKNVTQVENDAPEAPVTEAAAQAESPNAETLATEAAPQAKVKVCLVPGCGREAKIRGLCGRCCTSARKAIKDGKATWDSLEAMNLAAPPRTKAFGGEAGVFTKVLKARLAGEG